MKKLSDKQNGFAAPAMFAIAAIAFLGSLGVKGESGQTVAHAINPGPEKVTEFAAVETPVTDDGVWIDE